MSTITPTKATGISAVSAPEPAHAVSEMIDATETLYRFTVIMRTVIPSRAISRWSSRSQTQR
jgi:hypothetical protein